MLGEKSKNRKRSFEEERWLKEVKVPKNVHQSDRRTVRYFDLKGALFQVAIEHLPKNVASNRQNIAIGVNLRPFFAHQKTDIGNRLVVKQGSRFVSKRIDPFGRHFGQFDLIEHTWSAHLIGSLNRVT